jgi:hypothetical protein
VSVSFRNCTVFVKHVFDDKEIEKEKRKQAAEAAL